MGWPTWTVFAFGLLAVPINAFIIQFWRWAASHGGHEATVEDRWALLAILIVLGVAGGAIAAVIRRRKALILGLSLAQMAPTVIVFAGFLVGPA